MGRPVLPVPRTTTDVFLHDIATSLRLLTDRVQPSQPEGETVRLEEPASPRKTAAKKTARRRSDG